MRLKILSAAVLAFVFGWSPEARAKAPNILFILSDDHALEAISAYGSWLKDYARTPTLDRLAAEGMRFTNVCCNN